MIAFTIKLGALYLVKISRTWGNPILQGLLELGRGATTPNEG